MTQPRANFNPLLHSEQILDGFKAVLRTHLPLELHGTRISAEDVWQILCDASVHHLSIEASCQRLASAPSGNRLREVLLPALPDRCQLEDELNAVLCAALPRVLFKSKRRYSVAADITLLPYHGQPQATDSDVLRAGAKSGTNQFHGYATLSIVHHSQRFVLALHCVQLHERMDQILEALLARAEGLKIRVRRIFLDKEFYSLAVLRSLRQRQLSFVMPIPVRGRGREMTRICRGRRSHFARYRVQSRRHGTDTVRVAVVKRNRRPGQRKVVRWFVFAVAGLPVRMEAPQVFQLYRQRFGIESSYRQLNQVRARTSSRSPLLRLLLVGLALLLLNLYVALRQSLRSRPTPARNRRRTWLTLPRLASLLAHAIETICGLAPLIQLRPLPGFS